MHGTFERPRPDGSRPATAVVIGSGFGGLAAAVRLGARGYKVTVLERLDAPGGRAYVHRQDGFTFDAGPTIITAPYLFEELWRLCGRELSEDVTLKPLMPFYRLVFNDNTHFDCSDDADAMRREIARHAPGDLPGYARFMERSRETYEIGFQQWGAIPFDSFWFLLKSLPDIIRLGGWRSVYSVVSQFVKDPKIRMALSFHPLFVGGNPFSTTAIFTLISHLERLWGVHFAMGGTGKLVEGLVGLIEGQGGTLRLNADADRILVKDGKAAGVRLAGGEEIAADVVVSNADTSFTYSKLLRDHPRKVWTDTRLKITKQSMSLFVWYFGTKRQYPDVKHHTILMGPRYKELLRDIYQKKVLADDFSVYLHRPTATDPSMAPEGCDAFYVLSPVPNLQSGVDWREKAESYRKAIEADLEARLLPGLSREVISSRLLTPIEFRDRLNSERGAAFGFDPLLLQSAWFRPANRSEEVENLFLVGAGTHPGAGVPGVLCSAKILDGIVPDVSVFA